MFRPNREVAGQNSIVENLNPTFYLLQLQYSIVIMATITSINPFLFDVCTAFEAYISSPTYYNQEQFSHKKQSQIYTILKDLAAFILYNKESTNLKHYILSSFKLINNKLYKQSDRRSDKQHLQAIVQKAKVVGSDARAHYT